MTYKEFKIIEKSILIQDYINYNTLPSIDRLLYWRIALSNKLKDKKLPKGFIETEILATDYLLNKHNK